MTPWTLIRRSLRFHARSHFGVVLGAAIASATLIGALLVGDSIRETLRQRALQRLAGAWYALKPADRFFGGDVAQRLALPPTLGSPELSEGSYLELWRHPNIGVVSSLSFGGAISGFLALPRTASLPSGNALANHVQVFGEDGTFLLADDTGRYGPVAQGTVLVNSSLAAQLGVRPGNEIILRVQRYVSLASEAAIAPRRAITAGLRLRIHSILP